VKKIMGFFFKTWRELGVFLKPNKKPPTNLIVSGSFSILLKVGPPGHDPGTP